MIMTVSGQISAANVHVFHRTSLELYANPLTNVPTMQTATAT